MRLINCVITMSLIFLISTNGFTQDELKSRKEIRKERKMQIQNRVDSMITATDYVFTARSAHPMSMEVVDLTSGYELKVIGDSVSVYLPYYGRAYQSDYSSTEGGIKLEVLSEEYSLKNEKDGYEVSFKAESDSDTYTFNLSVSRSGYASLHVSSNNRQSITFNGILKGIGL